MIKEEVRSLGGSGRGQRRHLRQGGMGGNDVNIRVICEMLKKKTVFKLNVRYLEVENGPVVKST